MKIFIYLLTYIITIGISYAGEFNKSGNTSSQKMVKASIPSFSVGSAKHLARKASKMAKPAIPLPDGNTFVDNIVSPNCIIIMNYRDGSGQSIQIANVGTINVSCD